MTAPPIVKRLLEATAGEHPVISAVFDLDPTEFATAPARATQATSLIDAAHNLERADETLNHAARQAVRGDLDRLDRYLRSADFEAVVSRAGALAIYVSCGDDLFETVALSQPAASEIFLGREPRLEPVVREPVSQRWCAVLVSSRDVTIYRATGAQITAHGTESDYVRGHDQSDGNDEHSREQDIDSHLIAVAKQLAADARAGRFEVLVIGGPIAAATALRNRLGPDVRPLVLEQRLDVDASAATEADVATAVVALLASAWAREQEQTLRTFGDRQQTGTRAVAGTGDVLEALTEQRVETLLLAGDFHAAGAQCTRCGLLYRSDVSSCPVDGTATGPVQDLREPLIAAAIRQDAEVLVFENRPPPAPALGGARSGVGALLRF